MQRKSKVLIISARNLLLALLSVAISFSVLPAMSAELPIEMSWSPSLEVTALVKGREYQITVQNLYDFAQTAEVLLELKDDNGNVVNASSAVIKLEAHASHQMSFSANIGTKGATKAYISAREHRNVSTMKLYVSGNVADSGDGSIDAPFKSIQQAKRAVAELKQAGSIPVGGVTVYIRGGRYQFDSTLNFGSEDSGKNRASVVYCAYPGEKVEFVSGATIAGSGFTHEGNGVYRSPQLDSSILSGFTDTDHYRNPIFLGVYFDSTEMTLARYPDKGQPLMRVSDRLSNSGQNGKFTIPDELANRAKNYTASTATSNGDIKQFNKAWMVGTFSFEWEYRYNLVGKIDTANKTIESNGVFTFEPMADTSSGAKLYWYIYNVFEEMDAPGEFFIDYQNRYIYVIPPQGMNITSSTITIGNMTIPMIEFDAASYISIENINFIGSRDCFINVKSNTNNISIKGCNFSCSTGTVDEGSCAVILGGYKNLISGCSFRDLGSGAVSLEGGDRYTLKRSQNQVINNEFSNLGQLKHKAGIWQKGCGDRFANNRVSGSPGAAGTIGGNYNVYEYNEFFNCNTDMIHDFGILYGGADISARGNEIRYNYFHDNPDGLANVYLDDFLGETKVYGNLFDGVANYRGQKEAYAFFNHGGSYNSFYNNIVVNADKVGGAIVKSQDERWTHTNADGSTNGAGVIMMNILGSYYDLTDYYTRLSQNTTLNSKSVYTNLLSTYQRPTSDIWKTAFPKIQILLEQTFATGGGVKHIPLDTVIYDNVYANLDVLTNTGNPPLYNGRRDPVYVREAAAATAQNNSEFTTEQIFVDYNGGNLGLSDHLKQAYPEGEFFDIQKITCRSN